MIFLRTIFLILLGLYLAMATTLTAMDRIKKDNTRIEKDRKEEIIDLE